MGDDEEQRLIDANEALQNFNNARAAMEDVFQDNLLNNTLLMDTLERDRMVRTAGEWGNIDWGALDVGNLELAAQIFNVPAVRRAQVRAVSPDEIVFRRDDVADAVQYVSIARNAVDKATIDETIHPPDGYEFVLQCMDCTQTWPSLMHNEKLQCPFCEGPTQVFDVVNETSD